MHYYVVIKYYDKEYGMLVGGSISLVYFEAQVKHFSRGEATVSSTHLEDLGFDEAKRLYYFTYNGKNGYVRKDAMIDKAERSSEVLERLFGGESLEGRMTAFNVAKDIKAGKNSKVLVDGLLEYLKNGVGGPTIEMRAEHASIRTKLVRYAGIYVVRDGHAVLLYVIRDDSQADKMTKMFEESFKKEIIDYRNFTIRELKFPEELEEGPGSVSGWDVNAESPTTIGNGWLLERSFDPREMKIVVEAVTMKFKEKLAQLYLGFTKER